MHETYHTRNLIKPIRYKLFHDGVPYHIPISPLICPLAYFYMVGTSALKELISRKKRNMANR